MNKTKYIPILKGKAGEYQALQSLSDESKKEILPLIEAANIPWDYQNNKASKTPAEHLDKFVEKIVKCWGTEYPILLDLPVDLRDQKGKDGSHILSSIFTEARSQGLKVVPVTGLKRSVSYNDAIKLISDTDKRGVCLRLETSDITNPTVTDDLDAMLKAFGVKPASVDLILDFKEILPSQENTILLALQQAGSLIPHAKEWRSVTFTASSFPKDLSGVKPNTIERIARTEWLIWTSMQKDVKRFPLAMGYGDYTISHPVMTDVDPRIMTMSANIRYASGAEWVILKGKSIKTEGYKQYPDKLTKKLITMKDYRGPKFSAGDKYIHDCTNGKEGTGNATTWRFVGVNHHLQLAVDQLSKIS